MTIFKKKKNLHMQLRLSFFPQSRIKGRIDPRLLRFMLCAYLAKCQCSLVLCSHSGELEGAEPPPTCAAPACMVGRNKGLWIHYFLYEQVSEMGAEQWLYYPYPPAPSYPKGKSRFLCEEQFLPIAAPEVAQWYAFPCTGAEPKGSI